MKNGFVKFIIIAVVCFFMIKTCSMIFSSDKKETTKSVYTESPVDKLIKKFSNIPDYSIILNDMDSEGDGSRAKYKHKYQILIPNGEEIKQEVTAWEYVDPKYFNSNINNLGMEIVCKKNWKLTKQAVPAGYNHYVGNEKYGTWRTNSSGGSFWEFYGKYAFMSSMLNLVAFPARRSYWNDYYSGGYYGSSRSYYGPRGNTVYGTRKFASSPAGKSSSWASKPASFKEKVRTNVKRSSSTTKYSNKSYSSKTSTRTSRSSSRYRSSSSSRSRSGGFGK